MLTGEWTVETKEYQAMTEIFADFVAKEVMSNEATLKCFTQGDRNLIVKLYQWVKEAIKKLGMSNADRESYKALKKMETLLGKALEAGRGGVSLEEVEKGVRLSKEAEAKEKTAEKSTGKLAVARYHIEKTVGGKDVVVIEENILEGVSKSKWEDAVKDAISKFKPAIPISGRLIKVNADTVNEYLNSKYTSGIKKSDKVKYVDKMKAANQLDEIILATTNYVNEDLKHERKDNIKEFARGEVLMSIGNNKYKAEVIIGFTSGNNMVLYDIVNLTETAFSLRKKKVESPERQVSLIQEKQPSTPIITEKADLSSENAKKVEKTSTNIKTVRDEYIVAVNDGKGDAFGVDNVLVYAVGPLDDYKITKVVKINLNDETFLTEAREFIYERE